ncbi:MAG TPA: sulfotransferase [Chitinophagales bacterium]|nr:sulfotransferase [Chitinophagales bacterium]
MGQLFLAPALQFHHIVKSNGGVHPSRRKNLLPWIAKFVLFEPLRITEHILFSKKIISHRITHPPLFILGHYRSGTTYLQRLLATDTDFGYQTIFYSALPELMLGFEWILRPVLAACTRVSRAENKFHRIPFRWDFPGEEDVALTSFGRREALHWGNLFPEKFSDYFERYVLFSTGEKDKEAWKKNYLHFLKKLSIASKGKPLILKSPPNTARIPLLLELFPDAKFIHLYRDPLEVFQSSRNFWNIINRYHALRPVSDEQITELIFYSYNSMMRRYHETKHLIPRGNLLEISYHDLMKNPLYYQRKIYEAFGFEFNEKKKRSAEKFVSNTSGYKPVEYHLPEEEKQILLKKGIEYFSVWNKTSGVPNKISVSP